MLVNFFSIMVYDPICRLVSIVRRSDLYSLLQSWRRRCIVETFIAFYAVVECFDPFWLIKCVTDVCLFALWRWALAKTCSIGPVVAITVLDRQTRNNSSPRYGCLNLCYPVSMFDSIYEMLQWKQRSIKKTKNSNQKFFNHFVWVTHQIRTASN